MFHSCDRLLGKGMCYRKTFFKEDMLCKFTFLFKTLHEKIEPSDFGTNYNELIKKS